MTKVKQDVERITFPDGSWWEFRTEVSRGMRKVFNEIGIKALPDMEVNGNGLDAEAIEQAVTSEVLADRAKLARITNETQDAWLLLGTVRWSWKDDVTQEAIDEKLDRYTAKVLERMAELYRPMNKEQLKN